MNVIYVPGPAAREYAHLGLNHYSGCSYGCTYCYMKAMGQKYKTLRFDQPRAKLDVLRGLEADCRRLAGTRERVHLCFSTDPYQPLDEKEELTRKVLEMFRRYGIPFQVLTKGGLRALRDFDLYGGVDLFGVTLTTLDRLQAERWEPEAAIPMDRVKSLQVAHGRGIRTWVSLEPVIDPDAALQVIRETHEVVDLYKIGRIAHTDMGFSVNWRHFAVAVVGLCRSLGVKYYIKESLAKYLKAGDYENTDWRVVS
jgi:DNA repair photolyase